MNLRKFAKPKNPNQNQEKLPSEKLNNPNRVTSKKETSQASQVTTRPKVLSKAISRDEVEKIYSDPKKSGSFSANITEILRSIPSYSLHKPVRVKFKRRQIVVPTLFHTIMADLTFFEKPIKNKKSSYTPNVFLVVVDCFSRFSWVRGLKNAKAITVAAALDQILESMPIKPRFLSTDQGTG